MQLEVRRTKQRAWGEKGLETSIYDGRLISVYEVMKFLAAGVFYI